LEPVLSTLLLSRFIRFHQEAIMGAFIGLDVSLSKTAVCVVDRDGNRDPSQGISFQNA
jgi:hypothetical protein